MIAICQSSSDPGSSCCRESEQIPAGIFLNSSRCHRYLSSDGPNSLTSLKRKVSKPAAADYSRNQKTGRMMTVRYLFSLFIPASLSYQPALWFRRHGCSMHQPLRTLFMTSNEVHLPLDRYEKFIPEHLHKQSTFNLYYFYRLEFSYSRSSGPGGQNVNKLNTKAEIRFNVPTADWLEPEIRDRLMQYQSNKISNEGDLIVTSQEHR